jgi:ribosome-associated translation inhibitor RaiA
VRISVSAPGHDLDSDAHSSIERDLEKLARRLHQHDDAATRVRLTEGSPAEGWHAVLEVDYGKTHLMAKSTNGDMGQAIRAAREEILRQVNDRSRGGHSSFSKGT